MSNAASAIPASSQDLLNKLEAVRLVCQHTGCAQRYLGGDALSAIRMAAHRIDAELKTGYSGRVAAYLERVYAEDLAPTGLTVADLNPGGKAESERPRLEKELLQRALDRIKAR